MDEKRFERQIAFILEADKEKTILRQTHIGGYERQENDAEHAWHMAMMIYLLREYANEAFDTERAMMMALIHDVVEIDAGDTYAYDTAAMATQNAREARAAERIFGLLPDDQKKELRALFEEFEACATPEARFARAMDNLQPLLLNDFNGGRDWKKHGIKADQVLKRQARSRYGSEEIWRFSEALIRRNVKLGNLRADDKTPLTDTDCTTVILPMTDQNKKDLHVANQPFDVIGKLDVGLLDGRWQAAERLFDTATTKQYPNYNGATAEDYIRDQSRAAFLAYRASTCVGQILLAKSWNGYARIEDLHVAARFRGQGVGTALLRKAEEWASEQGIEALSAECQDNNLLASRFLQKNGFEIGGADVSLYKNLGQPYEDEIALYWYKSLNAPRNR